ncbi:MAG: patatin-like phospholipase family protein [Baekduia sp.]
MKGDDQAEGPAGAAATAKTDPGRKQRVAVVAAGAGARGAFEAGALSVLVPWLAERGMRPTVFVGTSAGAINAALLAANAHHEPATAADALLEFWRGLGVRKVYRSPLVSAPGTLATYIGQLFGRSHVVSLLDTSPMLTFAEQIFEPLEPALRENIKSGRVQALALVATDRAQRTTVFTDNAPRVPVPRANPGRAIDYRATEVTFKHVLASSAIPVLFRPVEIDGAYYTDGGVRLNAPLAPAAALGATHVAVVATHPETYPDAPPPQPQSQPPDAVDSMVAVLGSVLADRMVEDLHTLDKLNRVADGERVRRIPRLFVGPSARDEIGELATKVYEDRHRGRRAATELDFRALHSLIGAREKGSGDLLSYVYFDPAFADDAIELGIRYARDKTGSGDPWQPPLARAGRGVG